MFGVERWLCADASPTSGKDVRAFTNCLCGGISFLEKASPQPSPREREHGSKCSCDILNLDSHQPENLNPTFSYGDFQKERQHSSRYICNILILDCLSTVCPIGIIRSNSFQIFTSLPRFLELGRFKLGEIYNI